MEQNQSLMNGQGGQQPVGQGQGLMNGQQQMPPTDVAGMISNLFQNGASMGGNVDQFMQTPFQQPGSAPPRTMGEGGMVSMNPSGMPAQDTGSTAFMNNQQQQVQAPNPVAQIEQWRAPPPGYAEAVAAQQTEADAEAVRKEKEDQWKWNTGIYN